MFRPGTSPVILAVPDVYFCMTASFFISPARLRYNQWFCATRQGRRAV